MKKKLIFLSLLMTSLMFLFSCVKEKDPINEDETPIGNILKGTISVPTTLTADKIWIVEGELDVESDLIILPGTVVKFKAGASLAIGYLKYASLIAVGLPDKPILFTSNALLPAPGDWNGITFYENNSTSASSLAFVTIKYAGQYDFNGALNLKGTSIKMASCNIVNNKYNGINLEGEDSKFSLCDLNVIKDNGLHAVLCNGNAAMTFSAANIIEAAAGYGIHVDNTNITAKGTWSKFAADYYVEGNVAIGNANTAELTIAPGTTVKFTANSAFEIGYLTSGKLIANGSLLLPITFTSSANSRSAGDWNGIFFYENTANGTILDHCIVSYAGEYDYQGALYFRDVNSKVKISNSTISNSLYYAIYPDGNSTPILENNILLNNGSDIYVPID